MSPKSSNFAGEMKIGVFDSGYGGRSPPALRPRSQTADLAPATRTIFSFRLSPLFFFRSLFNSVYFIRLYI